MLVETENANCFENDRIHLLWIDIWGSFLMLVAVPNALLRLSNVIAVGENNGMSITGTAYRRIFVYLLFSGRKKRKI